MEKSTFSDYFFKIPMFPIWTSNSFLLLKNVIIYIKINS
jgi:hypothetical protein